MRSCRTWAAALAAAALVVRPALATPNFPAEVQTHLNLSYQPPCSLCHLNGITAAGTVRTPFGRAIVAQGVIAYSTTSLDRALDALAAASSDSDGDGVPDIQEIEQGTDPNVANVGDAGVTDTRVSPPEHGCSLARPHVGHGSRWTGTLLAMVALAFACGWRRCGAARAVSLESFRGADGARAKRAT